MIKQKNSGLAAANMPNDIDFPGKPNDTVRLKA